MKLSNDANAFSMGDLVNDNRESTQQNAFEIARKEYEEKQALLAQEKLNNDESYKKIKTYTMIGGGALGLIAIYLFLRAKNTKTA